MAYDAPPPVLEYGASRTRTAESAGLCTAVLLLSAALIPVSAALSVRGLIGDHRGMRIYEQREREAGTLKGLFTGQEKGFLARETSRHGWTLSRWAMSASALGIALGVTGLALWRRRLHRIRWRFVWTIAAHVVVGASTLLYWMMTGIPAPWVD